MRQDPTARHTNCRRAGQENIPPHPEGEARSRAPPHLHALEHEVLLADLHRALALLNEALWEEKTRRELSSRKY